MAELWRRDSVVITGLSYTSPVVVHVSGISEAVRTCVEVGEVRTVWSATSVVGLEEV